MSDGATTAALSGTPTKERFLGVDVARGVALLSMLAANVFDNLDDNGEPTLAVMTVTGRAATMFVMVAGISLAFITGGRNPVQGGDRRAVAAGLAVRALLIGAIGLALGYAAPDDFAVILPYYGLFFLLVIPLVGLRPRTLICIAGGLLVAGPLLVLWAFSLGLQPVTEGGLTFGDAVTDPIGVVLQLLVTSNRFHLDRSCHRAARSVLHQGRYPAFGRRAGAGRHRVGRVVGAPVQAGRAAAPGRRCRARVGSGDGQE
jgi:hypothetical protein